MRSDQILAILAGVLGLLIVLAVYAVLGTLSIINDTLGGEDFEAVDDSMPHIVAGVALLSASMVVPFAINNKKIVGVSLIVLAAGIAIAVSAFGMLSSILLVIAGVASLRRKDTESKA